MRDAEVGVTSGCVEHWAEECRIAFQTVSISKELRIISIVGKSALGSQTKGGCDLVDAEGTT